MGIAHSIQRRGIAQPDASQRTSPRFRLPLFVAERMTIVLTVKVLLPDGCPASGLLQALRSAANRSLDPTPMDGAISGDIVAQALASFK